MTVRTVTRRNERTGKEWEVYLIDFRFQRLDGTKGRFKSTARAKSRRAAEAEERAIRKEIEGGTITGRRSHRRHWRNLQRNLSGIMRR